jgi:hypothetical protein
MIILQGIMIVYAVIMAGIIAVLALGPVYLEIMEWWRCGKASRHLH